MEPTVIPTVEPTPSPTEVSKFKLGNISDVTGPAAPALTVVDGALADLVKYFNDNNLIPGLEVEVEAYDSQYNPANTKAAYEWLIERDADVIVTGLPPIIDVVYPMCTEDEVALLTIACNAEAIVLPTWNFAFEVTTQSFMYTLMPWIEQNDPNFPTDRPAKIGGVGFAGNYAQYLQDSAKAYVDANPDKWEWIGGHILGWETVTFGPEVDAMMDADYIIPPSTGFYIGSFIKEYRDAGGEANFLGTDAHNAYMGLIVDAVGGWDAIDGMLFALPNRWYNEDSEVTNLMNQLLMDYHGASEAASMKKAGSSYQGAFHMWWGILMLIQETAEQHGSDNVNSQTIYDTATSFTLNMDGGQVLSFSETERTAWDYFGIYEASAADEDLMRIGADDWWPVRTEP
ncbi:ABC transporter substrate-binding protein [Chloroflexota bacterium]